MAACNAHSNTQQKLGHPDARARRPSFDGAAYGHNTFVCSDFAPTRFSSSGARADTNLVLSALMGRTKSRTASQATQPGEKGQQSRCSDAHSRLSLPIRKRLSFPTSMTMPFHIQAFLSSDVSGPTQGA